jgi:hypothetical protein
MNKIILAFDGAHFSEGAFEFARSLNELDPIMLTGVFLPQAELGSAWSYAISHGGSVITPIDQKQQQKVEENIERFGNLCQQHQIQYRIHKDENDFALNELKLESKYADLLLLGTESYYKNMGTETPNDYLIDAIHDVGCPVMLIPENYYFPKSIVLAYDGSYNSIFALKQFAYLFPKLGTLETTLVYASDDPKDDFLHKMQLEELATQHFSNLTLEKLELNPKKYFATWMSERNSTLLVTGSFGRSDLSQVFHKSFVTDIIADHKFPIFVAHK